MTSDICKPTLERLRHAGADSARLTERPMRIDADPIDKLKTRKAITKPQFDAGEMLFEHYVKSSLHRNGAGGAYEDKIDRSMGELMPAEHIKFHTDAYFAAVDELQPGPERNIVLGVIIRHELVQHAADGTGYSQKRDRITAGMTLLRNGLDRLAAHFGLTPRENIDRGRHARISEGGKPVVDDTLWERKSESRRT